MLVADTIEVVFQVNGKVRGKGLLPAGSTEEALKEAALADGSVRPHTDGKTIRRVVVVQGRLVNVVAG
jgi:leucyl-tRNA synthetase